MHEIVEYIFMAANEFMEESGLRMDEDHVGKPQELYLWCSVGGAKIWSSLPVVLASSTSPRPGII